jgi:hypothetical protein
MQPSPEGPPRANFPSLSLGKRATRRRLHRQIVVHLKRTDYDRLRALRPGFADNTPPKIARDLMLFALTLVEQRRVDPQQIMGGAQ